MATRNHSNKPTKRRALDGVDPPSSSCSSPARQPFIWCNLPPHPSPLAFHSPSEFESHYHAQHAHTCTLSASNTLRTRTEPTPPPPPPPYDIRARSSRVLTKSSPDHRGSDLESPTESDPDDEEKEEEQVTVTSQSGWTGKVGSQHESSNCEMIEEGEGNPPPRRTHSPLISRKVRRSQRCSKTFPTSRFLDLHIEECHSPLSIQRMERGESIFSCFLEPDQCGESFLTPKERRKHLIESHGYPPNYFFSLPFKGTGELFKRYGPTASLLRGDWKRVEGRRRRRGGRGIDDDETGQEDGKDEEMRIDPLRPEKRSSDLDDRQENLGKGRKRKLQEPEQDEAESGMENATSSSEIERDPPPNSLPSSSNHEPSDRRTLDENDEKFKAGTENDGLASIMDSMSSLSLVPDKIRIHRQRPKV